MENSSRLTAQPCRAVTAEEVDHFREFGWVKLKGFVDPDVVRAMLEVAREKMGDDADSNSGGAVAGARKSKNAYFNAELGEGPAHPVLGPVIYGVGKSAKQLMRR